MEWGMGNGIKETRKIRAEIRGMGWRSRCRESAWECGKSGWKIENEYFYKNVDSHIDLVILDIFPAMLFHFYYWFSTGKYRLGRISKMDLCHFRINSRSSSFYTFSIQSDVFFYIPIFRGYYASMSRL